MPSDALAKEGWFNMHYVYLVRSLAEPAERYIGTDPQIHIDAIEKLFASAASIAISGLFTIFSQRRLP